MPLLGNRRRHGGTVTMLRCVPVHLVSNTSCRNSKSFMQINSLVRIQGANLYRGSCFIRLGLRSILRWPIKGGIQIHDGQDTNQK